MINRKNCIVTLSNYSHGDSTTHSPYRIFSLAIQRSYYHHGTKIQEQNSTINNRHLSVCPSTCPPIRTSQSTFWLLNHRYSFAQKILKILILKNNMYVLYV